MNLKRIPEMVNNAFQKAMGGKPGPVYLDFPADVLYEKVDESQVDWRLSGRPLLNPRPLGDPDRMREAAARWNQESPLHDLAGRARQLAQSSDAWILVRKPLGEHGTVHCRIRDEKTWRSHYVPVFPEHIVSQDACGARPTRSSLRAMSALLSKQDIC